MLAVVYRVLFLSHYPYTAPELFVESVTISIHFGLNILRLIFIIHIDTEHTTNPPWIFRNQSRKVSRPWKIAAFLVPVILRAVGVKKFKRGRKALRQVSGPTKAGKTNNE